MTIVIEPPKDVEETITQEATRMGLSVSEYVLRAAVEKAKTDAGQTPARAVEEGSLADAVKPFLGTVGGSVGPGDGHAWSEIEAAYDHCEKQQDLDITQLSDGGDGKTQVVRIVQQRLETPAKA